MYLGVAELLTTYTEPVKFRSKLIMMTQVYIAEIWEVIMLV